MRGNIQYLATGPEQFRTALNPLLAAHAKEGLRGLYVNQEELFDYYNFGRYGPQAIQNAVRAIRPQYLLLAGRTTYDYHDYSGSGVDPLCPTFLVPTTFWSQSESDAAYGDLGRGISEVSVGRMPFDTSADMSGAVARTLAHAGSWTSGWHGHIVTDQADLPVYDFPAEGRDFVASVPEIEWSENFYGVTNSEVSQVTDALQQAASHGSDVIVYIGHGNASVLGNQVPRILDASLVQAWTGNVVLLQSSCNGNWIAKDVNAWHSIAAQALSQPQGGIAASISSSTYMDSAPHVAFMKELLSLAHSPGTRWGTALLKTQQWAAQQSTFGGPFAGWYADLSRTESLLGDPALRVFRK